MHVIATAEGYDGVGVRKPGDVFDMPEGAKGTWFKPYPDEKSKPEEGAKPHKGNAKA